MELAAVVNTAGTHEPLTTWLSAIANSQGFNSW